ncbi:MAG: hypothetical protein J6I49_07805 [Bacteroidales bacterium]|nr:hypothetical protein [Bacteroidales bacterium]
MNIAKLLTALAVALIPLTAAAQTGHDLQDDGLRGTVKRVDATMYEASYDMNDNVSRGDQLEHLVTEYNQRGQRRSQTYLSVAEDIIFRTRYKHDGFGLTTLEHVVDNQERVIGRTYYVYDADHRLIEVYVEDAERQVESRMRLKHDKLGRIEQRSYNDHVNEIFKREKYLFNADGTVNKAMIYDRSKQKVQEKRWEYDAQGEPTSYTLYDYTEAEPEMFVTLYEREYDSHGNWVRCTEYEVLGDRKFPTYTTIRTIEYF